jgi:hypothetical protein
VLIDGQATRSCRIALSDVAGKAVTTIEGLSAEGTHPVQLAWMQILALIVLFMRQLDLSCVFRFDRDTWVRHGGDRRAVDCDRD